MVADHRKIWSDNLLHSTNWNSIIGGAWWSGMICLDWTWKLRCLDQKQNVFPRFYDQLKLNLLILQYVTKHSRSSLRLLGTVGEAINVKAWLWYHRVVGEGRCPIVDTWWQTETGATMISPLPGAWPLKPGSATLPFFGVQVESYSLLFSGFIWLLIL